MAVASFFPQRATSRLVALASTWACVWGSACVSSPPSLAQAPPDRVDHDVAASEKAGARAEAGEELETEDEDAAIRAKHAGVEAARAREQSVRSFEEVELRVGSEYLDETQVRVLARIPLRRPGEVKAQRRMYAADSQIAVSRLDEARLTRKAERCFPAVEAHARLQEIIIFDGYAQQQQQLIDYNEEGRENGLVNEIDAMRFELASRVRLVTREPAPLQVAEAAEAALPLLVPPGAPLVRDEMTLREAVRQHHPSVAVHLATASRYEAMADRERSLSRPWIKFVDFTYRHRTAEKRDNAPDKPAANGGGGRVAFTIPFGGEKANSRRYQALVREQRGEAEATVDDQMLRGRLALDRLHAFESRTQRLLDLLLLADEAEAVAERWWQSKLARPKQVADLLDEAFSARRAVLFARERAGVARCSLLAMTGVAAEDWPRAGADLPAIASDEISDTPEAR